MAGMAEQQHPSGLVDGQDRHGGQQQELMPDNGPQPGNMRGDTHLRNPSGLTYAYAADHDGCGTG